MTIDEAILRTLEEIRPRRATERQLQTWTNEKLLAPISLGELRLKLSTLEGAGRVSFVDDGFGEKTWFITADGVAALISK